MQHVFRKQLILVCIAALLFVVLLGGGVFFVGFIRTQIGQTRELKEKIASYEKNKKTFTDEVLHIKTLEARVEALESTIVTPEGVPLLLSRLEALATKSGVSFEITSVQNPVVDEKPMLSVESSMTGSRETILAFLGTLTEQPIALHINKLFLFSEEGGVSSVPTAGTLQVDQKKPVNSTARWRAVATIHVLSF
jgi:Tfp pilus assembly protein PilO